MNRLEKLENMWSADRSDADIPYMIAQEHVAAGDHDAALAWFDRCLEIDQEYHYAYFQKARALEEAERTDEALAAARAGLERAKVGSDTKATEELTGLLEMLGG